MKKSRYNIIKILKKDLKKSSFYNNSYKWFAINRRKCEKINRLQLLINTDFYR